jgi:GTPase SAR1 family protein
MGKFGQVIVGPPGSGKTTYCNGIKEFLSNLERPVLAVNLDPANENLPYTCDIDINELITLENVMEEFNLGPNGGLIYAIEFLEKNFDWLLKKLEQYTDNYVIFDCPGQVELYTHHDSMRKIFKLLQKEGYSICCVHLIDSYYCSSASNYIAAVLTSLGTMIHLELPHVNVLSKIDLIEKLGKLDFDLEYYANATELEFLEDVLDKQMNPKFKEMNRCLCEAVSDFGLVSFSVLDIQVQFKSLTQRT